MNGQIKNQLNQKYSNQKKQANKIKVKKYNQKLNKMKKVLFCSILANYTFKSDKLNEIAS